MWIVFVSDAQGVSQREWGAIMDSMAPDSTALNDLKLTLQQRKADVVELERKVADGERTRLVSLHVEVGLPTIESLIIRLQEVVTSSPKRKSTNSSSASADVKAKVRVDLQNGVPAEEVMAKHSVSSRVITGIQADIAKTAAASPAAPAAGSKSAKAGSTSLAGAGAKV